MNATSPTANSFVFLIPSQGKPDPQEPRGFNGPDSRSRVIQHGSPNKTYYPPIYAALNSLRNRYKAPNTENLPERKFEKLVSSIYKQLRPLKDQVLNEELIAKIEKIIGPLFDHHKTSPAELFNHFKERYPTLSRLQSSNLDWGKLEPQRKHRLLMTFFQRLSADGYNIQLSPWKPKDPVDALIRELNARGPLVVMGNFGPNIYCKQPVFLKKIGDQKIYGWDLPTKKWENSSQQVNPILIIGAEKNQKAQHVYYINPTDESDPAHPEKQKVYVMRYETLTAPNAIYDLGSLVSSQNSHHLTESTGYAYYGPPAASVSENRAEKPEEKIDLTEQPKEPTIPCEQIAATEKPEEKVEEKIEPAEEPNETPLTTDEAIDWELIDEKNQPLDQSNPDISGWEDLQTPEEEKSATVST